MSSQPILLRAGDRVPIRILDQGHGSIALVLVPGWCCLSGIWDHQVEHFASRYRVVRVDLAYDSEDCSRTQWTIPAFGQDVRAVVERLGLNQVVLVGHSMAGAIVIEAAQRMPERVLGVVGIDTWRSVATHRTPAQVSAMLAPYRADFPAAIRASVQNTLLLKTTAPSIVTTVQEMMAGVPREPAISIAEDAWLNDRRIEEGLKALRVRKLAINARPTDQAAAQACGVEVSMQTGVGHFGMMEDPDCFNALLDQAAGALSLFAERGELPGSEHRSQ